MTLASRRRPVEPHFVLARCQTKPPSTKFYMAENKQIFTCRLLEGPLEGASLSQAEASIKEEPVQQPVISYLVQDGSFCCKAWEGSNKQGVPLPLGDLDRGVQGRWGAVAVAALQVW